MGISRTSPCAVSVAELPPEPSGATVCPVKQIWEVWTISIYLFSMRGFKEVTTLVRSLFRMLLVPVALRSVTLGGSDIVKSSYLVSPWPSLESLSC